MNYVTATHWLFAPPSAGLQHVLATDLESLAISTEIRKEMLKGFVDHCVEKYQYKAWKKGTVSIFHVAGTKGKGSTCTFLHECLSATGSSVRLEFLTYQTILHSQAKTNSITGIIFKSTHSLCERKNQSKSLVDFKRGTDRRGRILTKLHKIQPIASVCKFL
jgi:UDP-N-acetylmuramyl tripeptide synthase